MRFAVNDLMTCTKESSITLFEYFTHLYFVYNWGHDTCNSHIKGLVILRVRKNGTHLCLIIQVFGALPPSSLSTSPLPKVAYYNVIVLLQCSPNSMLVLYFLCSTRQTHVWHYLFDIFFTLGLIPFLERLIPSSPGGSLFFSSRCSLNHCPREKWFRFLRPSFHLFPLETDSLPWGAYYIFVLEGVDSFLQGLTSFFLEGADSLLLQRNELEEVDSVLHSSSGVVPFLFEEWKLVHSPFRCLVTISLSS